MDAHQERMKKEDKWFHDHEKKILDELKRKRETRIKETLEQGDKRKREELKKAHWMCCPKCGQGMETRDFKGIEVDVCAFCEGIFFDRGELEGLLEKEYEARKSFFFDLLGLS